MSPNNDPFAGFDAGQTFVMPTPGARPAAMPASTPTGFAREAALDIAYQPAGLNPLIAAANPLLNLIPQMRQITAEQSPQTSGSSTSRAQFGHHSFTSFGAGGFGDGSSCILKMSVACEPDSWRR